MSGGKTFGNSPCQTGPQSRSAVISSSEVSWPEQEQLFNLLAQAERQNAIDLDNSEISYSLQHPEHYRHPIFGPHLLLSYFQILQLQSSGQINLPEAERIVSSWEPRFASEHHGIVATSFYGLSAVTPLLAESGPGISALRRALDRRQLGSANRLLPENIDATSARSLTETILFAAASDALEQADPEYKQEIAAVRQLLEERRQELTIASRVGQKQTDELPLVIHAGVTMRSDQSFPGAGYALRICDQHGHDQPLTVISAAGGFSDQMFTYNAVHEMIHSNQSVSDVRPLTGYIQGPADWDLEQRTAFSEALTDALAAVRTGQEPAYEPEALALSELLSEAGQPATSLPGLLDELNGESMLAATHHLATVCQNNTEQFVDRFFQRLSELTASYGQAEFAARSQAGFSYLLNR